MQFIVFDFEVFAKDWLVVLKKGEEIKVIHNNVSLLRDYYEDNKNNIFVGFNNKHYDDYIFKGILSDLNPKKINDFIIYKKKFGWEYPGINNIPIITLDIRQDITGALSLSLKEAEGNMGSSIEESNIDFNIERKLTNEELESTIKYCIHDVKSTEKILLERKTDISTRLELLKMFNLPIQNIGKTNAKLTAGILQARKQARNDELKYDFPNNLKIKNRKILDLYDKIINYDDVLVTDINNVEHTLAYGGLHGAKKGIFEGNIWYVDVKSYYPTLMLKYDYISRNLRDSRKYKEIYDLRMEYKKKGDSKEGALKLLLNTTYGAMKNKYNPLFDPKQANQVCITGQLFLVDLLEKIEPYTELLQSNTDGIIFISNNDAKVKDLIDEWQNRTELDFKILKVDKLWQKDVNNYILKIGDYIETKGGYVKYFKGGSFRNNSATIIDKAIVDYFVHNIPVEETINNSNNLIDFQYICKKGPTYIHVEHNGKIINNCNRVFASKSKEVGKLYKVKECGRKDSIANLPDNCIIVNEDLTQTTFNIKEVDKQWYIIKATERINDFLKE